MNDYRSPLPLLTKKKMYDSWLSVFERRECGSVILWPKSDRLYRISHFIEEYKNIFPKNWEVQQLSLQSLNSEENDEFINYFTNKLADKNRRYCFVISDGEWLLSTAPNIIPVLNQLFHKHRNFSFLVFFEANLLDPVYDSLISQCMPLIQNLIHHPLYQKEDIFHFLEHMTRLHNSKITEADKQNIWDNCAGNIWIATDVWRHFKATGILSFTHPSFLFRLDAIWRGFSEAEKDALTTVLNPHSLPDDFGDNPAVKHLSSLKILENTNGKWTVTVPALKRYIQEKHAQNLKLKIGADDRLYLNNIAVSTFLSKREENFLIRLLTEKYKIVSRNDTAQILWGNGAEPSDWALDQTIKRLRHKLSKLIPKHIGFIKTIKGKGYIFEGVHV